MRFVLLIGVVSLFADMSYEGARSITGPFLASDGFDLDEFVLLVHVVEDPKGRDSYLPFGQLVRSEPFSVLGLPRRLMAELRLDRLDDAPLIVGSQEP